MTTSVGGSTTTGSSSSYSVVSSLSTSLTSNSGYVGLAISTFLIGFSIMTVCVDISVDGFFVSTV